MLFRSQGDLGVKQGPEGTFEGLIWLASERATGAGTVESGKEGTFKHIDSNGDF